MALVVSKVNGLLYDVLQLVIEKHSNAHVWLTGTDASVDRDGRRALVDIIKRCVPVALRESFQQEHAALNYPANVDPQPILAREQRLVRDNKAADWTPTEATRKLSLYTRLDPVFYAAVKAWAATEAGKAALASPFSGGASALLSSDEHQVLLGKIRELTELVQRASGSAGRLSRWYSGSGIRRSGSTGSDRRDASRSGRGSG
ncbi:hypothetical protein CYMTET_39978 [Cymbomonas tetramitiformis]|uniref:Uncharacterized protein n=1 Tax=Cymbomonas tetramitiformis TaxID=36881 RepID=A0AAE0F3Z7_9CHLO|nr:hypothetical protein CYMTET_39978 [Cymbomonas tetramitiformis]